MTKNRKIKIIILAAGKGTRMKTDLPKALCSVRGKHMIRHLIDSINKAYEGKPYVIVGYRADLVKSELKDSCFYIMQNEQLGTGHAVSCAKEDCKDAEDIMVLLGDHPFIKAKTIEKLISKHLKSKAKITFTTTKPKDFLDWRKAFTTFGRILRKNGKVIGIREYKDATEKEKKIKEVNAGCYIFNGKWLWKNLEKIKNENAQKEYYLTDLFQIASENKEKIETINIDPKEDLGANTKEELEVLEKFAV